MTGVIEKMRDWNFLKFMDIKKLKTVAVSTTAFMLAAYMYVYTNGVFLYDTAEFYRGTEPFGFGSDKWVAPLLGLLDMHINEPWLAGVWAILLMIASVYLIVDILEVESVWGICLVAGLCSTQSSMICQQRYSGGQYTGEAALLFACLAAWIFLKSKMGILWKVALSAACIVISCGIYGAFISMTPSLMILSIVMDIVYKGKSAKETWKKAVCSAGQFILGMISYYAILRVGLHKSGAQLDSYMGEDSLQSVQGVVAKQNYILEAYERIIRYYLGRVPVPYLPDNLERMALISLLIGCGISLVTFLRYRKKIADFKYNLVLLLALLAVLPLSLNLIYVFASGEVHYLMIFTYVLPYVFFVKVMEKAVCDKEGWTTGYLLGSLYKIALCVFVYYSVVLANAATTNWCDMYETARSIGTRVLDRIESCEGFDGTETIYLAGGMQYNDYFGVPEQEAEILDADLGLGYPNLTTGFDHMFLTKIMHSEMRYDLNGTVEELVGELREKGVEEDIVEQVSKMPAFPYDGSVQKIGDNIYVIISTDEMRKEYGEKYGS